MIKKLVICTHENKIFNLLISKLKNFKKIEVEFSDLNKYFHNKEFDIINSPTTLMESFNSKPMDLDCQIIETKNKWELTNYVVTSPNFTLPSKLSKLEMGFYQIQIPLKKVQEYFKNASVVYAIHTEYSFAYFDVINDELIDKILISINNILNQEN